jgi:hypothetical protein
MVVDVFPECAVGPAVGPAGQTNGDRQSFSSDFSAARGNLKRFGKNRYEIIDSAGIRSISKQTVRFSTRSLKTNRNRRKRVEWAGRRTPSIWPGSRCQKWLARTLHAPARTLHAPCTHLARTCTHLARTFARTFWAPWFNTATDRPIF